MENEVKFPSNSHELSTQKATSAFQSQGYGFQATEKSITILNGKFRYQLLTEKSINNS